MPGRSSERQPDITNAEMVLATIQQKFIGDEMKRTWRAAFTPLQWPNGKPSPTFSAHEDVAC